MLPDSTPTLSDGCADFIDDLALETRLKEGASRGLAERRASFREGLLGLVRRVAGDGASR